jgi:glutamine---fructose-6-phosphate transaminase (isomerizing)
LAIIHSSEPNRVIGVRSGSPLVLGLTDNEYFLASDRLALAGVASKFIYLEEGDIADLSSKGIAIYDSSLHSVERAIQNFKLQGDVVNRGIYRHFMQKEIFEQPEAIANTLMDRLEANHVLANIFGDVADKIFSKVKRIQIVACGTSYHAGLSARFWLEEFANIPCQVDVASEFRYKKNIIEPDTLLIVISQSGETADTLAVVRQAKQLPYLARLAICNVAESSLTREADLCFITSAGAEIGVASTKAFTTQLVALFLLALALGKYNGLDIKIETRLVQYLRHLPNLIEEVLTLNDSIIDLAQCFAHKAHALYLGRGICHSIALEGALKMKELSYIHAEAFAAGELKHGPLALVDVNMPVIVLMPSDELLLKLRNNIKEVAARGGELIVLTDQTLDSHDEKSIKVLKMPKVSREIAPIIYTVPLQLLAYHVAVLKGTDVDQPRNLAKSVTVE